MALTNDQVSWLKQLSKMLQEIVEGNSISRQQWKALSEHMKSPLSDDLDQDKCLDGVQPFLDATSGDELDADPVLAGVQPRMKDTLLLEPNHALILETVALSIDNMLEENEHTHRHRPR